MKKIILGMFVFALLASTAVYAERGSRDGRDDDTATSTKSELRKNIKNLNRTSTADTSCVAEAISEREESILSAWNTLDTEVVKILEARKSSLVSAWALTDAKERKVALKEVWTNSKKDRKEAASEYKNVKKEAWAEFKKAARACGGNVGSEASGESEAGEKLEI